ncbi:MAG: COG3014 family protein [Leptospirales bacterium]
MSQLLLWKGRMIVSVAGMDFPFGGLRFSWVFLLMAMVSCSPPVSQYHHYYSALSRYPGTGPDKEPVRIIRKARSSYPDRDMVLYGMDLGMANDVVGDFRESSLVFRNTERLDERLYTKSVGDMALSYQTNDLVLPFRGTPFERVMINLVNSLNYAGMGDWNGALVETRKIREKLVRYNRRYPKTTLAGGKYSRFEGGAARLLSQHQIPFNPTQLNHYTDDGFARFLSGIYQEAQIRLGGVDYQSALLSYRKAFRVYQKDNLLYGTNLPSFLIPALLRAADAAGRPHLVTRLQKRFPGVPWIPVSRFEHLGHILFVGYNGRIFHLTSERFAFPFPIGDQLPLISFDIPRPKGGGTTVSGHRLKAVGLANLPVLKVQSEPADDLDAIGKTNFQDHLKRIVLREAVRAILKTTEEVVSQHEATQYGGPLGGILAMVVGDVATYVSDVADTRSWRTLPAMFDYAQMDLEPGTYTIEMQGEGGSAHFQRRRVTLVAGEYLLIRDVDVN